MLVFDRLVHLDTESIWKVKVQGYTGKNVHLSATNAQYEVTCTF